MTNFVDIFLQPSLAFANIKARPTFLIPLLIVMAFSGALTLIYFMKVDPSWYLDHTLLASGSEMSAAELAKAKQMMPGARTLGFIAAPTAALSIAVISAFYAFYFMLAGKITGLNISFRQGMGLACWSNMPIVLGILVSLFVAATMSPQTSFESLMLTNIDPLILQLPLDSAWSKLAKSFNLLNLWSWFLLALGWKTWGKTSWIHASIVALLPSLVIYGVMAIIALLQ
jgi:hypothetical protein